MTTATTLLTWQVLTAKRYGLNRDLPHANPDLTWVANSSTLIAGERDAVLVDTFLTADQAKILLEWVVASGKNLTAIYITHGHGDHFFGLAPLLERFPRARALATPDVVNAMRDQLSPAWLDGFWRKRVPGQILDHLVTAEPFEDGQLDLEGHQLVVVDTGRTDTAHTTSLYIPSLALIVAGDVVYNGIHPYLAETDSESRLGWVAALDKLEALNPRAVVAGHKVPEADDDPCNIGLTREYLRDFDRLNTTTATALELYDAMLALYPDRANPGSLWSAATAAKKPAPAV